MSEQPHVPPPDPERRARIVGELRVEPGQPAGVAQRPTRWPPAAEFADTSRAGLEAAAKDILGSGIQQLRRAQELLWAGDSRALLVVFQAMDAAGKDSTIKHVMTGVNPQGVRVVSFRRPSSDELDHTFLWRTARAAPERGMIGIFNRSHYEEVVALRVHPEWLDRQRLPESDHGEEFWQERYDDINAFERHLDRNGTSVVKFYLHLSRAEQKRRFLRRLDNPDKIWKFNPADLAERERWDDYVAAFDAALTATSTPWAPWYVIPADQKPVMRALVAAVLVDTIGSLDLHWPTVSAEDLARCDEARQTLTAEPDDEPVRA